MVKDHKTAMLSGFALPIDRRRFLGNVAAGLVAGTSLSLPTLARAGEPKRGGHFRIAMRTGSSADTLDPATYSDNYAVNALWGAWSNSLCMVDVEGNAVGDLAESFESSQDFKIWHFRLRKGVEFHDGKSLTPDDVVASIRHHMGPDTRSIARALVSQIEDVKTDGPDGVVFALSGGNIDFPYILADYHLPIMPDVDGEAKWDTVRTGAFSMEEFTPGVRTRLKRNPNYYRPVYFDSTEVLCIPDTNSRMNALVTGEVDYADSLDLATLHLLERNPNISILEVPGYGHYGYDMNVTIPPFDNPDVRKAIKLSLDREDIFNKILFGRGMIGNDNPISPSVKFGIELDDVHHYDPEQAKSLLKKAGHERLAISVSAADIAFPGSVEASVLWQQHAMACNIDLQVVRESNDGYWEQVWNNKPLTASYWGGRPTIDAQFSSYYAADAPYNGTHWKNPRFNELLVQGRSEADEDKRAAIYAEMQQLVHEDGGLICIAFFSHISGHVSNLAHGEVGADRQDDGGRIFERWWFDS